MCRTGKRHGDFPGPRSRRCSWGTIRGRYIRRGASFDFLYFNWGYESVLDEHGSDVLFSAEVRDAVKQQDGRICRAGFANDVRSRAVPRDIGGSLQFEKYVRRINTKKNPSLSISKQLEP
jgi:hypothetical protein